MPLRISLLRTRLLQRSHPWPRYPAQAAVSDPLNAFASVKRLMGRSAAAAREQLGEGCPAAVVAGPQGQALLACPGLGRALAPEEVCAVQGCT